MTLYTVLLTIHIFSAILGMGPGFIMIRILKHARNLPELRQAYTIRNSVHIFVMAGGLLLLLSGISMGMLRRYLFYEGWYVTSLILFLIALAFGPLILAPISRPIKRILKEASGKDIPESYYIISKKLFFFERLENFIFLVIIALMILKPF